MMGMRIMPSPWGGYSSGSEDSVIVREDNVTASKVTRDQVEETTVYPIRLKDCGSKYSRALVDVEGTPLVNDVGQALNVYTKAMKDAFDSGRLRLVHCMKEPTYAYFVTSDYQMRLFQKDRKRGILPHRQTYYVYVDEDIDRLSREYRENFIPFHKPHNQHRNKTAVL
jgi:hypothetical protein